MTDPYDRVAYPTARHSGTHPGRLAARAKLFGVQAARPSACRILEIGCGDGANLLAHAEALPGSHFVGVDVAGAPIARGQAELASRGLTNVVLHQRDLRDVDDGPYDFIIAHGVYAWVPSDVQDALMALLGRALAPSGVAFVSYAALPGAHLRQVIRDALLSHLGAWSVTDHHAPGPDAVRSEARALLEILARTWSSGPPGPRVDPRAGLGQLARDILARARDTLLHDELGPVSRPVSVTDFVGHARAHGLEFLCESDLYEMNPAPFVETAGPWLALVPDGDVVAREQVLDHLKVRSYRETLLCRASARPSPHPLADALSDAHVQLRASPRGTMWVTPVGGALQTADPALLAALGRLHDASPATLPVAETGLSPALVLDLIASSLIDVWAEPHSPPTR